MALDLNQRLSNNFVLRELLVSDYAVRQDITEQFEPAQVIIDNLQSLCINVLQPLREQLNTAIHITSGYRCLRVNSGIGGAATSQHIEGKAADVHITDQTIEELFMKIRTLNLPFDQLIQEFDHWVHISYDPARNRKQVLRAIKANGKTVYKPA